MEEDLMDEYERVTFTVEEMGRRIGISWAKANDRARGDSASCVRTERRPVVPPVGGGCVLDVAATSVVER